ncbi:MAG TPA: Rieske 2Fe-2S domain-containing protein [Chloroflexota bacterium]|nr:Rieske 2Fe-2S domain-containing protein [Chloroflexota bacterium]
MLSKEENDLLTRVGPGTPGGDLLRRYWQPVALAEELPPDGPPIPVRLLGEDLVLFREPSLGPGEPGRPGLLGIHCAHRGADLSYGRLEDGGLRCIYHGWLYDGRGRCLEQPGEPAGSTFHERVRQPAYPCQEVGGLILAYLGPGEPPLVPNYEFLTAPQEQCYPTKLFQECSYLQGNEGNIDPSHHSFLHLRYGEGEDSQFTWYAGDRSPTIETEETAYGARIYAIRRIDEHRNYIKITNFILPNLSAISGDADGYGVNWHVPIDDTHHWKYNLTFRRSRAIDKAVRARGRTSMTADYHPIRHKENRYQQDRAEMRGITFAGLGRDFQAQDACVTEGAGPIQDRSTEHLGYTDKGIIAARKVLLRALRASQAGQDPAHVIRDPADNSFSDLFARKDVVPVELGWSRYWEREAAEGQRVLALTTGTA